MSKYFEIFVLWKQWWVWKTFFAILTLDPARKAFDIQEGSLLSSPKSLFLFREWYYICDTFATSLMCQANLEVLDFYPFTKSYLEGTGGPEVAHYKEHDTVHFKYIAMKPIDIFLEDYFRGKVPRSINLTNYEFSWWIFLQYGSRKMEPPESHRSHHRHIGSGHILLHNVTSHHIISHCITSCRLISYRITSRR